MRVAPALSSGGGEGCTVLGLAPPLQLPAASHLLLCCNRQMDMGCAAPGLDIARCNICAL